jgi:hypothetical protein
MILGSSLRSVNFAILLGIGVVLGLIGPGSSLGVTVLVVVVAAMSVRMFNRYLRADSSD